MARHCEVCGKTKWTGFKLSHSHIRTKRTWEPNLQKKKVLLNGVTPTRIQICTGCIQKGKHLNVQTKKLFSVVEKGEKAGKRALLAKKGSPLGNKKG